MITKLFQLAENHCVLKKIYKINSLANKFNAREITSIDVDDGKSSDDFLKKLR